MVTAKNVTELGRGIFGEGVIKKLRPAAVCNQRTGRKIYVKAVLLKPAFHLMHADSHAAFKFFQAGSATIESTDNRICPQRIPYVLVDAPVNCGSAGYLAENIECIVDVVLESLRTADHLLTADKYAAGQFGG